MEAVFGLLLMLLGVSHGLETKCDVRQKNGTQCYGALGGAVVLQLMDRAAERFIIKKNTHTILRWINNTISHNIKNDKYSFTPSDGMLRIDNLIISDTDQYKLQIRNLNGALLENRTLQLYIQGKQLFILQCLPCSVLETVTDDHDSVNMSNIIFVPPAPVSSVRLVPECLSQGEMRMSCSSEGGDSPQYSWTLDRHTLTEDKLLSGNNETDKITLRQNIEGVLSCSVKNNVSHLESYQRISTCGFIFINCTDSNETRITGWVYGANNTLCDEPPTTHKAGDMTVGKKTAVTVSLKPSISITSSNQTVTSSFKDEPWFIIMAGLLAALVFLLVVGGAVMCALKKKKTNQLEEEGDEQELTYADVRIKQRGPVQQRANPEEVEYGQIKFSERPRRTVEPREDDCVYAKVR